jgi:putative ABC transport system substrate-binding protein
MKRREFISFLGGAAAWPLAAHAQQPNGMRRIGALMNLAADDREGQVRYKAFLQGLQASGWIEGHNVQIQSGQSPLPVRMLDLFRNARLCCYRLSPIKP